VVDPPLHAPDLDPLELAFLDAVRAMGATTPAVPTVPTVPGRTEHGGSVAVARAGDPSRTTTHRRPDRPVREGARLTVGEAERLFDAQLLSRHTDHAARWLRTRGLGHYTIGSAGHEGNAAVAAALRPGDPALLHYRSGGFYLARSAMVRQPRLAGVRDVLAGVLALVEEPVAGGRHKVFGHPDLAVVPQTSTIASHLPRAVGLAFAVERARRLGVPTRWDDDAVVMCSFGDASVNHSTAQGAFNTAGYTVHQGLALPLLFVCEDNGWGISVPSPAGWVAATLSSRPGLRYATADGCDLAETFEVARELVDHVRHERSPAVLHLRTVRFMGHAGTDVESAYRSPASSRADLARDPLLATARLLVGAGSSTPDEVVERYLSSRREVRALAVELSTHRTLETVDEVVAPLSPRRPAAVASRVLAAAPRDDRRRFFGGTLPEDEGPLTLAETINRTLGDVLLAMPNAMVFGEDVGVKGGVYGVTRGLQKRAGAARVFDTLLDEQSILGLALGAGLSGLLPIPEIQYLAYLHNAEDQLRGEAASLSFFSNGAYRNPLVVRIAGLAYQKGFGGHFHNDDAIAVLRDVPGLVVACPGHPSDAAPMLRTCVAAADVDGTVSVFLEPIALYHCRDLHTPGDAGWTASYAAPGRWSGAHVPIGQGRVARQGDDVLVVTWANGLHLSLRAARRLAARGITCRVFDLRWLAPMPIDEVHAHAAEIGRVLVVDETRRSGGVGEGVLSGLAERGYTGRVERLAAADSFVPLGNAADLVLVGEDDVVDGVLRLLGET
jgi:2-oxoisovalerate dehydrogenase E1 component